MTTGYPAWILERSFGGLGTAVSPVSAKSKSRWPDGPSSPMAREACDALVAACNRDTKATDLRCMVFLVGGAGNGKSKLAADTVARIRGKLLGERGPFAKRTYAYELASGGRLHVLNDATIPPDDAHATPLVRDLSTAITSGDHMLACINRGVLISETAVASLDDSSPATRLAFWITDWLLTGNTPDNGRREARLELVENPERPGYYSFAEAWVEDTMRFAIHVVYMDHASLLEHWTIPTNVVGDYRTALEFGSVDVTPVLSPDRRSRETAFEACLRGAANQYCGELDVDPLDPIGANAISLGGKDAACGWCSLLRGAEVISGTHFTYRDLWALYVHSLVGPITSQGLETLSSWVRDRIAVVRNATGEDPLSSLLGLGSLRTHMMLFDAGKVQNQQASFIEEYSWPRTANEALGSVRLADPLRHFGPADGIETTRLAERLAEIEEGRLPVAQLATEDSAVGQYWTELDAEIEKAIRDEVDPGNDMASLKKRNWLLGWYGRYMYRLIGLARGWPAHSSTVHEWQNAWLDADRRQRLSADLEDAILEIVAPSSGQEARTYFTFLQPRVDAGEGALERVLVSLPRNRFEVAARTEGDRIELVIDQGRYGEGSPAAITSLDFHLLREAMATRNGHGFTDSLKLIEPRIERIRASLVTDQFSQPENRHRFKFSHRGETIVTR